MGKFRPFFLGAIVVAFVAISLFMIAVGDTLIGAMGLCFFGGCGVVFLAAPAGQQGRKAANRGRAADSSAVRFGFNAPHLAVMALGGLLMGVGAVLMSVMGAPVWVAWPAAALGLACALALAWRAADKRPVVIVDAAGLFDRRILRAPLRWEDIHALSFDGPFGVAFLTIHPAEGTALSTRKRQLRIGDVQLDGSLSDILAAIHRFRPQIIILAPGD